MAKANNTTNSSGGILSSSAFITGILSFSVVASYYLANSTDWEFVELTLLGAEMCWVFTFLCAEKCGILDFMAHKSVKHSELIGNSVKNHKAGSSAKLLIII
jgi:hypothetical protein